jgi:hypothetical protein
MSWTYDDLYGWADDSELEDDVDLVIFNQVADEIFGPVPETDCAGDAGTTAIAGISDSGRHHRVEASAD